MNNGSESHASDATAPGQSIPPAVDPGAIQTAPPKAAPDRVVLPPPSVEERAAEDTARQQRNLHLLDGLLVVLVLGLAFLCALFPIRNSDFLMHLATGKFLAEGKYTFGVDPFSVNTQGVRWVNHSWLLDLAGYQLFAAIGDKALTILKAVLVTALAGVLLMIRRPGQSLWIPAMCTGLAILAISPRLVMQPPVLSFFFLALTLWILALRPKATTEQDTSLLARFASWPYRLYTLPVLFALWVNVDSWFILGPITVALYWLGQTLQDAFGPVPNGPDAPEAGERRRLFFVLLIGLAACLANPYHVYAFQLPAEISPWIAKEIREDAHLKAIFAKPLTEEYLSRNRLLYDVSRMAFYPLLILSAASFALNLTGWRWWRALVWAAFAGLGVSHERSIPFFAVAAGPIMALNFQDAMMSRAVDRHAVALSPSLWSTAGRALSVLLLAIALAAAWPGWLHGFPDEPDAENRRVGLGLRLDNALRETAEQLAQWRREGKIAEESHAFNFHPDVANYMALYCPEEKTAIDYRLSLFRDTAATYFRVRGDLNSAPSVEQYSSSLRGSEAEWQKFFRARHIGHVVVYDPNQRNMLAAIQRMEQDKSQPESARQWTLIDLRGRVALYAWSDPKMGRNATVRAMEMRPDERAFGAAADAAPGTRPAGPSARDYWSQYSTAVPARAPDSYAAWFHLHSRDLETARAQRAAGGEYAGQIAAVVGLGAVPRTVAEKTVYFLGPWLAMNSGPAGKFHSPASTLLAIRAARRALANNADDGLAYFLLAIAYQGLPENASHYDLYNPQSLVGEVRRCQIAGSLYNAIALQPEEPEFHKELAQLYFGESYLDLSLKHWKEYLRLTEEAGPRFEREDAYKDRLNRMRDEVKKLDEQVKQSLSQFLTETQGLTDVLSKVKMAQSRGLADQALNLLLAADREVELHDFGELMELQLLLQVGRAEEPVFFELRDKENKKYDWVLAMHAAAIGDYDQADKYLARLIPQTRETQIGQVTRDVVQQLRAGWMDLADPFKTGPLAGQIINRYLSELRFRHLRTLSIASVQEGELVILRGLLAVEAGRNKAAAECFREALALSLPPARYVPYLAILGTTDPLQQAASYTINTEMCSGPYVALPSQQWASEYLKLLEAAAK